MAIGRPIELTPNITSKNISIAATEGQTDFTVTGGYRINEIAVYRNGVRLVDGRDFSATDGTTVTLISDTVDADDVLEFSVFDSFDIAGVIVGAASSQAVNGNLHVTGELYAGDFLPAQLNVTGVGTIGIGSFTDINVSGAATVAGTLVAGSFSGDGSALTGVANTDYVVSIATTTGDLTVSAAATIGGAVNIDATTDSTSVTTGALIVDGGLGVAKNVYIGAGLSVAGTLTYQDVTEVDSVGMVTAKSGVNISGGQLTVGVAYSVGNAGVVTATGYHGGSAENVWTLGASGTDHYTFTGPGDLSAATDPTLNLIRGQRYRFKNLSGGHPFRIQSTVNGSAGTAYNDGVTNNDGGNGTDIVFDVPYDAPSVLYYQCTAHANMGGVMYIGGSGYEISVGTGITMGSAGVTTFSGTSDVHLLDNVKLNVGTDEDLAIFSNGSNSYLLSKSGTDIHIESKNDLYLKTGDGSTGLHTVLYAQNNAGVDLRYDNSVKLATTNDGLSITGIVTTSAGVAYTGLLREAFAKTGGKLSDNTNIDLEDGMVHYFTTTETATSTPNLRWNSSFSLANKMNVNDAITVTIITTAAAAAYSANLTIDGNAVTEQWVGGSAPAAGGADGYDIYTYNILKIGTGTGDSGFFVIGNVVNAT